MPLGLTLLVVATILVLFGVGQRMLDRMRLSDKTAVLFMVAIFIGSLIPDIPLGRDLFINIGGAVVPLILVIYLFVKAGTGMEKARAAIAAILSGLGVYLAGRYMPSEPETIIIRSQLCLWYYRRSYRLFVWTVPESIFYCRSIRCDTGRSGSGN